MGCIELCAVAHAAQRETPTQIPIGFCANLSVSASVSVSPHMVDTSCFCIRSNLKNVIFVTFINWSTC